MVQKDNELGRFNLISKVLNFSAERYFRTAGDLFIYEGDYDSALNMVEKTLELDAENVRALVLKGDILFCLNEDLKALQALNKAIEINNTCAEAYISRAGVLDVLGKYRAALDSCDLALAQVDSSIDYLLPTLCDQKLSLLVRLKKYRQAQLFLKQCRRKMTDGDFEGLCYGYQSLLDSQCRTRKTEGSTSRKQHLRLVSSS